ncbi:Karyopherin-like protein [Blumeria hordei DH14]|uniref:Karyopherin-like protein n=1 Tax=Blumeria graminis f. sp. hordei (strain DH14) TaxID=546991 RepID=N1J6H1_BLUG1|nr:Karyopherin-like protein [Blumeria hordei DH14]
MDEKRFLELLQDIQIPDTERVKAATTELRKQYYPHPESLAYLLQILTSHHDDGVRQQAAIESLRLIQKHWTSITDDKKSVIRDVLLQGTLGEQKPLLRHASARVIASIAAIDFKNQQWPQLASILAHATTSDQVSHRETGTYIIYTLLESDCEIFQDKTSELFQLFGNTIKSTESNEVRINTLLCLGRIAALIKPDEDEINLSRFHEIFPQMVAVLKTAIDEDNEDHIMQAFEVFQNLLCSESALLNKHFKDLISFMMEISSTTSISDESRTQALSFLMQSAKFRKMKIQGTKDLGEMLTLKSILIATEIDDEADDDDDDEVTPSKTALGLLDLLATNLPPRQVIVPLLQALPQYVQNSDPKFRQAGILALGMCVEGAPDFIGTQLDNLVPMISQLLDDPEIRVRGAALNSVARLADDLAEELCKHHQALVPLLVKNLDASSSLSQTGGKESSRSLEILKSSCGALDSVSRGIDKAIMLTYIPELVPRLGNLLSHPDMNVKASAAGALGSIAESAENEFMPYFESSMKALSQFVTIKHTFEELDLRGVVCDALGSIAVAVGAEAFRPYVNDLMQASEEGLHLGHPRLRETSYILWSTLAKVYGLEFNPYLEGVVKGLFESLEQTETEDQLDLGDGNQELLGEEVNISRNKLLSTSSSNCCSEEMCNDHDSDWDDDFSHTAVAMEKEVAIEVLGDVLSHTRRHFMPYFEKAVEITLGLVEHGYDGVRKGAIGTLWRSYACLWAIMEDDSGQKWTPGLPLKQTPSGEALKLGELVTAATTSIWDDEMNRAVVTDINRNVAATLKLCGPAILTQNNFTERTITTCAAIITKSHSCQQDLGDENGQGETEDEESAEYDWLVIDTALDVIIGLSKAIGNQFSDIWRVFQKPIMKLASSQTNYERSTAVGVIAECTSSMGEAVSPYTKELLNILLHRLGDEDAETKSNATYALGQLIFNSTSSNEYLGSYETILSKLEPLLQIQNARTLDNAAGCLCRMIMAHIDRVPVDEMLPMLVDVLPLKEDYEENGPIFECITGLYQQSHPTILSLTSKLIPIFNAVLDEPKTQIETNIREKIVETVKFIAAKDPNIVQGNLVLSHVLTS